MRRWEQMRTGGRGRWISRWGFIPRPGEPPKEAKWETTDSSFCLQGTRGLQGSRWQVGGWGCPGSPEALLKAGVRTRGSEQIRLDLSNMNSTCCCQGVGDGEPRDAPGAVERVGVNHCGPGTPS